ncbi:hypothetical protein V6Z72_04145 [Cereibacter sphaeroides]|uniref:hypothetical protein n=1 Tax=Cereibacter sphaeroides TaxID=1063 RepID=UPI003990B692
MSEAKEPISNQPRYGLAVGTFFVMPLGMAANAKFNNLTGGADFSLNSLLLPLCVSPLVFGAFAAIVRTELDFLSGALIAFQNGFFWQQIFDGLAKANGAN